MELDHVGRATNILGATARDENVFTQGDYAAFASAPREVYSSQGIYAKVGDKTVSVKGGFSQRYLAYLKKT